MSISNLTIAEIIGKTVPFLNEKGLPNPRLEADLMLAHVLDLPRVKLYSQWDRLLTPLEIQNYRQIIVKRVQGWPLAYLTGKKAFLSWDFLVTPSVLIPRPETELLVETAFDLVKGRSGIVGVDVGTGSGIIAITLAKLIPDSIWYATDISSEALQVATENACHLGVDTRVTFINGDLLDPIYSLASPLPRFDLIVSNPPYVPSGEIDNLQAEVRQEPFLALDGGEDGLMIYRRLIPQAVKILKDDGFLLLEHGHDQRSSLETLLAGVGLNCQSFSDLAGWERVLVGNNRATSHA